MASSGFGDIRDLEDDLKTQDETSPQRLDSISLTDAQLNSILDRLVGR